MASGIFGCSACCGSPEIWGTGFRPFVPILQLSVYSGSTVLEHYAVQSAHLSGFRVVTLASPKDLGAFEGLDVDVVFDVGIPPNP